MSLIVDQLEKTFGEGQAETTVLKNLNFEVSEGEFIILTGASGSGKTTLLTILGGLLSQSAGEIRFNQQPLFNNSKKASSLRLTEIGFIFQSSHLVPYLTVEEQLITVGKEAGQSARAAKQRARKLLTEIGLEKRLTVYPNHLSGGEKQRVAIMRAFMNDPKMILADEPTASLDADRATYVVEMLRNHIKKDNKVGIMITHDQRLFDYADRVIYLEDGQIKEKE
ncbi:ABC transporter ATP-binding protein [Staphylococcus sp. SQ8-PEA]|uniref:ABC transporter ATP-binding protein n=1 Tax=Staphylococcus marylandisciuri TaxID=2981529 RepID=A0ABT2QMR3_9STAP|nr:ABC transporter ATP-binding protein [Staphylococcus marylandisciuri]MCU5745256.1 ABC transporter ATP-binding protein [Staphylococcus marylandisciuri]